MHEILGRLRAAGRSYCGIIALLATLAAGEGWSQDASWFTGFTRLPEGQGAFTLHVTPAVEHSFQSSTNLRDWSTLFVFASTGNVFAVTSPVPLVELGPQMFFRSATGRVLNFDFRFQFHVQGGTFTGGTTPAVSYPVSIHDYTANLDVEWETNPAPLGQVIFTGPAGSGLANSAATARYDWEDGCTFATANVTTPPVPPTGPWQVVYRSQTNHFLPPALPLDQSVALPVPTVTLNGGLLTRVDWTYHNPTNGVVVSAPAFLEDVEVQLDGAGYERIYNSDELPPDSTSHVLTESILWNDVISLAIACTDLQGRHFVIFYQKP